MHAWLVEWIGARDELLPLRDDVRRCRIVTASGVLEVKWEDLAATRRHTGCAGPAHFPGPALCCCFASPSSRLISRRPLFSLGLCRWS